MSEQLNRGRRDSCDTDLVPPVAFAGAAFTRSMNERVLTSFVKYGIARKSSKMPAGGVG